MRAAKLINTGKTMTKNQILKTIEAICSQHRLGIEEITEAFASNGVLYLISNKYAMGANSEPLPRHYCSYKGVTPVWSVQESWSGPDGNFIVPTIVGGI